MTRVRKRQDPAKYRAWYLANPEIVQAQRDRRYARVRKEREAKRDAYAAVLVSMGCRQIAGFPFYYVSSKGEVFSCMNRRGMKISPGVKPGGYEFVGLRGDKLSYKMVHRLVAEAFLPNPDQLPAVNHIDADKRNNTIQNLEWVTHLQNSDHAHRLGLHPVNPGRKLTHEQVREVREAKWGTYKEIGRAFGVCAQIVCNVKRRSTYKDVE